MKTTQTNPLLRVIASVASKSSVALGDNVILNVDILMAHDASGPQHWWSRLKELNAEPWDLNKVVIVSDHYVPGVDVKSANILSLTRKFAHTFHVPHFYDSIGVCHTLLAEKGFALPNRFIMGGDSHTPTSGAFGCLAIGFGATDTTATLVTGKTWIKVPSVFNIQWNGNLQNGVTAKDMALYHCKTFGVGNVFKAVHFSGDTIQNLSMESRMVLTNMSAEMGCTTGFISPDDTTWAYLKHIKPYEGGFDETPNDTYENVYTFQADNLSPQVAAPDLPSNTQDIETYINTPVNQCYIGSCTGGRVEDFHMAAEILKGHTVKKPLIIAPSSSDILKTISNDGTLDILLDSKAILLTPACGACAGYGAGILADGEVAISSTNRNFKGRMGNKNSSVYLASPYTVAASAIKGTITHPGEFL